MAKIVNKKYQRPKSCLSNKLTGIIKPINAENNHISNPKNST